MVRERGSAVILVSILILSITLLAWSVISTWHASLDNAASSSMLESAKAEGLPPRLDSEEAKASLFYPVMKSRGPQRGGSLAARPLDGPRGP